MQSSSSNYSQPIFKKQCRSRLAPVIVIMNDSGNCDDEQDLDNSFNDLKQWAMYMKNSCQCKHPKLGLFYEVEPSDDADESTSEEIIEKIKSLNFQFTKCTEMRKMRNIGIQVQEPNLVESHDAETQMSEISIDSVVDYPMNKYISTLNDRRYPQSSDSKEDSCENHWPQVIVSCAQPIETESMFWSPNNKYKHNTRMRSLSVGCGRTSTATVTKRAQSIAKMTRLFQILTYTEDQNGLKFSSSANNYNLTTVLNHDSSTSSEMKSIFSNNVDKDDDDTLTVTTVPTPENQFRVIQDVPSPTPIQHNSLSVSFVVNTLLKILKKPTSTIGLPSSSKKMIAHSFKSISSPEMRSFKQNLQQIVTDIVINKESLLQQHKKLSSNQINKIQKNLKILIEGKNKTLNKSKLKLNTVRKHKIAQGTGESLRVRPVPPKKEVNDNSGNGDIEMQTDFTYKLTGTKRPKPDVEEVSQAEVKLQDIDDVREMLSRSCSFTKMGPKINCVCKLEDIQECTIESLQLLADNLLLKKTQQLLSNVQGPLLSHNCSCSDVNDATQHMHANDAWNDTY